MEHAWDGGGGGGCGVFMHPLYVLGFICIQIILFYVVYVV